MALKFLSVYVHRSTLPQSRFRSTAPSEREPGNAPHNVNHPPAGYFDSGRVIFGVCVGGDILPFIGVLAKPWGWRAIFIAPTKLRDFDTVPLIGGHSLSQPFGRDSSLREGAGRGAYHSIGCTLKSQVSGDFHRPYGTLNVLHFTIPWGWGLRKWGGGGRMWEKSSKRRCLWTIPTVCCVPGSVE